jgi:hypothetical protein
VKIAKMQPLELTLRLQILLFQARLFFKERENRESLAIAVVVVLLASFLFKKSDLNLLGEGVTDSTPPPGVKVVPVSESQYKEAMKP